MIQRKHIHHIVPKHAGGTDDIDNLIEVTIEEHANLHQQRFLEFGEEFDRIAFLSLSGQITMSEAKRLAQLEGASRGGLASHRAKIDRGIETIGEWNTRTQHIRTIATKESCQKGAAITNQKLRDTGKRQELQHKRSVAGGKASNKLLQKRRFECTECGYSSTAGALGHHKKKTGHQFKREILCQQ